MQTITLQPRHISVTARLFCEHIGSTKVPEPAKGRGGRPSKHAAEVMPDDPLAAHKEVMQALFAKAKRGDAAAIKQWNELNAPQSEDPFNVSVNVTPYNIQDKNLPKIAMMADTPVVLEIVEGIRTRMEADEAPRELKDLGRAFYLQLDDWMRKAYEPKDV